ncbi:MAG: carbohydrate kinase [Firmicutes bacterium]|nr:carbohydrate kinase [Bacillota bacterium]
MADIISLGEVLIDLTQTRVREDGVAEFAAFPGGAPANVAVAAARLGTKAGFIGKVGRDGFGRSLRQTLEKEGVDTSTLFDTDESPTTLAIVSVDERGERSFAFYRQPGADTCLTEEEAVRFLDGETLPRILHFGSLSLTNEPSRSAAKAAVARAREAGILISYDPNFRPALWSDTEEAVRWMKAPFDMVDILKISDEELPLLTGTEDLEKGSRILADQGIQLVLVTLGSQGVFYRLGEVTGSIPGVPTQVADTNGAGDTFLGAVLSKLTSYVGEDGSIELSLLSEEMLREHLSFANRAAAKTCSRPGAIPAMPTLEEMGR